MTNANTPADDLEGIELSSGWKIGPKIPKAKSGTGANFGICYSATRGNETAFVKAVDFRRAFSASDLIGALSRMTQEVSWEKDVLEFCEQHGLSRIVRLLDHEYVLLEKHKGDDTRRVSCLVMEVGEGDLRGALNLQVDKSHSWNLYVMRDVTLAVDQLHRKGIAHLDVKPSNVIAIGGPADAKLMKLGDLARVVRKGYAGPFDAESWPGDRGYQPPEKWYGFRSPQWTDEREAADAYLLGSLYVFLLTGLSMGTLLYSEVPESYKPEEYRSGFSDELIDVLIDAHARVIRAYVAPYLPTSCKDELERIVVELTHPVPSRRGDRKARQSGIVGIDRFHQKFLRLAAWLEREERRVSK